MAVYDQRPEETSRAFNAFRIYRDMGAMRTLASTAKKLGRTASLCEKWSRKHHWVIRARQWDADRDRLAQQAEITALKEMRKRQTKLAITLQSIGGSELMKLLKAVQSNPDMELDHHTVLRYISEGTGLERLSRGEPTAIEEHREQPVIDYTKLTVDELRELRKLSKKIKTDTDPQTED